MEKTDSGFDNQNRELGEEEVLFGFVDEEEDSDSFNETGTDKAQEVSNSIDSSWMDEFGGKVGTEILRLLTRSICC